MSRKRDNTAERIRRLEAQVDALLAEVQALRAENAELRRENAELRARLDERDQPPPPPTTDGATPFARKQRKSEPKPPGRRKGEGNFLFRQMPTPNRPEVDVPPPAGPCPACGANATAIVERHETVTITSLPPREPVVTPYRVPTCRCAACGASRRGTHPDLRADQTGATAHRYGDDVMAVATILHYAVGVPVRRVPRVMEMLTGVAPTQSAITQHALKQADPGGAVDAAVERLRAQLTGAPIVHTDDTSWRVTHERARTPDRKAYVMGFESAGAPPCMSEGDANPPAVGAGAGVDPLVCVFQIRAQHRNDEVRELIPADWPGVLVTDRGSSYDANELAGVRQQKCHAHIVRNIADAQAAQHPGARSFGNALRSVLAAIRALWSGWHAGGLDDAEYLALGDELSSELTRLLADRELKDPSNQRLLDGLGERDDLGDLARCLSDPWVEPTNNRAERLLRRLVIARKVSQCSKTWRGARATASFASVLSTLARRCLDPLASLIAVMRGHPLPAAAR